MKLKFALSPKTVTGALFLLEVAFLYNVLVLAAHFLNPDDVITESERLVDAIADLCYVYHLFVFVSRLFIDAKGFRRDDTFSLSTLRKNWKNIALHVVAVIDLSWIEEAVHHSVPINLRIARLVIAPIVLNNMLGFEDLTIAIATSFAWQLCLVAAFWLLCHHPDARQYMPWRSTPLNLLITYFSIPFITGIFSKKPEEKGPTATQLEEQESEGNDRELSEICDDMIKKARLLTLVMAAHPEEFLQDIRSMLKHETFRPGQKLAAIGEVGHHMFFLARGTVVGSTANVTFKLGAGTSFGEIALMRPMSKRTATLAALTKCEVFLLNQDAFDRLRSTYPELAHSVRLEVGKYLRMDSARYVTICMRSATRACYVVAASFFSIIYLLLLIMKST
eukprot:m.191573 g.191573  ORF g.191573 m.191573 type:complete len:392 (+) comp14845_c0_seq2:252-1427(+)